jgi:hypothetical protein
MQTLSGRIISFPARDTATAPAGTGTVTAPELRARMEVAFTTFYNGLFDSACTTNDKHHHEHTLQLLRIVKARESTIIDSVCAEAARAGTTGEASGTLRLRHYFTQHCADLPLAPADWAPLKSAFDELMLAPAGRVAVTHPAAGESADSVDSTARIVERLRAGGLHLPLGFELAESATDPADEQAPEPEVPTAVVPESRISVVLRALKLSLAALPVLVLAPVGLGPATPPEAATPLLAVHGAAAPRAEQAPDTRIAAAAQVAGQSAAAAAPAAAQAPVAEPPAAAASQPAAAALENTAPLAAAAEPKAAADARLAMQVDFLLRRGDAALAELRLTEPFPDSAAANYAAVLALDAHNVAAQQGLERIVAAYAGLARGALKDGDTSYAQQLMERARSVLPDAAELQQLEHDITSSHVAQR